MIDSRSPAIPTDEDRLAALQQLVWEADLQLPVPSQSVIEFSARARRPDVTIAELAAIVDCEPALTTELLRHVNSSVLGLRKKIETVAQAINVLGVSNCTTILLTSALSKAVEQFESPLFTTTDFRRETVERSLFARETAQHLGLDASITFTAAMLQDILLPVLTIRYQVDYHEYLNGEFSSLVEFERDRFGWTHPEITARTLLEWGFPRSLVLAVLRHHDSAEQMLVERDAVPEAFACCAAALFMDVMNQSPDGVTRLVDLRGMDSRFQFVEIALQVDDAVQKLGGSLQHPVSLVQRIQNAMLNQLEARRRQSVAPGRQFGNYVLEERLKESSMGAIFRARHIRLKRPAAVKVLRAERTTPESIAQFEQEVQLTCTLSHPNTVSIFDYGHTPDGLFYYAMELVDGVTLADLVKLDGRIPDGRVIALLQQACASLAEAHALNLIHRDIKPENIMVSHRTSHPDHITVLDFGLVTTTGTRAGASELRGVVGTPLYMSPEAAQGRNNADQRSDLYSLAAVGYTMLTGKPVFTGQTVMEVLQQHLRSTPIPPSERSDAPICSQLEQLIMRCLQKDPNARPVSALEFAAELARCQPAQPWTNEAAAQWWSQRTSPPECSELLQRTSTDSFAATFIAHKIPDPESTGALTLMDAVAL